MVDMPYPTWSEWLQVKEQQQMMPQQPQMMNPQMAQQPQMGQQRGPQLGKPVAQQFGRFQDKYAKRAAPARKQAAGGLVQQITQNLPTKNVRDIGKSLLKSKQ
jgi:hypothetical protein